MKKAAVLEKDLTQDKLKEHAHYKNLLGLIEQLETGELVYVLKNNTEPFWNLYFDIS